MAIAWAGDALAQTDRIALESALADACDATDAVVRAELPCVADEESRGHGLTAGLRSTRGDSFELGVSYLDFDITGGQTIWSGSGWKVDVMARF